MEVGISVGVVCAASGFEVSFHLGKNSTSEAASNKAQQSKTMTSFRGFLAFLPFCGTFFGVPLGVSSVISSLFSCSAASQTASSALRLASCSAAMRAASSALRLASCSAAKREDSEELRLD